MNRSLQTILKRISAVALTLVLIVSAALGQADDTQVKAKAKLAFDVAKRFFSGEVIACRALFGKST